MKAALLLLLALILPACQHRSYPETVHESELLTIERIGEHVYRHVSLLSIPNYGDFPCNGLVYLKEGRAVVVDTPVDEASSAELIAWIEAEGAEIAAVVPTHFHVDCLGGLGAFHEDGVRSVANSETIELARAMKKVIPTQGFTDRIELDDVGPLRVIVDHVGAGHTDDNIVVYLPDERVLFGGCLVKSLGAGRGNLNDADTLAWAGTVRKVRDRYADARIVVPGHGPPGDATLLDYTIRMFE